MAARSQNSSTAKASEWPIQTDKRTWRACAPKGPGRWGRLLTRVARCVHDVKACESNGGAGRAGRVGRRQDSYCACAQPSWAFSRWCPRWRLFLDRATWSELRGTRSVCWHLQPRPITPQIPFHTTSTHLSFPPPALPRKFRRGAKATRPVSAEPTARRVQGLVIKRGIYSLALVNSQVDQSASSPIHLLP